MKIYTIHAAKTQLSKLIEFSEGGEQVVIARGDIPVVRLVAIKKPKRKFGALRNRCQVTSAFFESLPDDELKRWNGL